MGISGSFKDFQWEADINEDELDADSATVEVITPTGGKIAFTVYGPWEDDMDVFSDIVQDDVEAYVNLS